MDRRVFFKITGLTAAQTALAVAHHSLAQESATSPATSAALIAPSSAHAQEGPSNGLKPWWTEEPLRIIEVCNAFDKEFATVSLDREVQAVQELGGNAQHFHCMSMSADAHDTAGLSDERFYFKTALSRRAHPDRLAAYLPLAHQRGIRVVVYFNVHSYSRGFGKVHPDWQQIKEDGSAISEVYETGTSFCVNSPYREWVFQILRDLCQYDIDGIFFDGPIFFEKTCYCPACQRQFREKTGQELPAKSERSSPRWHELVEFQAASIARFLADSQKVIKTSNPQILFYMNGNANWPYWPTGRDNRQIIAQTDILGAEGGFLHGDLNSNQLPLYKPGITAKLVSYQAQGKPSVVFDCAGQKPWSWYRLPETEIGMLLAQTLAGGANYWLAVFPDDLGQPGLDVVGRFGRLVAAHPEVYAKSRSLAKVALVWPAHGCNYYSNSSVPLTDFTRQISASGAGDLSAEFLGMYEALVAAQIPFDVIDEAALEGVPAYELIVMPNVALLSTQAAAALTSFVERGGHLFATFETSLYDEHGQRRDDFALGSLFGVTFTGEQFGPMKWDYVTPVPGKDSLESLGNTQKFLPSPTYGLKVKATTGAALWGYCEHLQGRYEHTPVASKLPFVVENHYGKGSVFYAAGTFGASLATNRFPEYRRLVRHVVAKTSPAPVTLDDAPWVEVSWRQSGKSRYLHLINETTGLKRPMTSLAAVRDLKINLTSPAKSARALLANADLPLHQEAGRSWLVLPELREYEVIALQP